MPHPRREGVCLGIFAAVNTLAKGRRLDDNQEAFRQAMNGWFNDNLPLPTDTVPDLYANDQQQVLAWFRGSATAHLARVPGYLAILDAHGIGWQRRLADDPGTIRYEDAFHVVAVTLPESGFPS
jgi:hypothetical protein